MVDKHIEQKLDDLVFNVLTQRQKLFERYADPRRDIDSECGFPTTINTHDYQKMYDRELGRKIVDLFPNHCWKILPDIYETEDQDVETEFEAAWNSVGAHLKGRPSYQTEQDCTPIYNYLKRLDQQCGIGSFGIMVLGIDDGLELSMPAAMRPVTKEQKDIVANFDSTQFQYGFFQGKVYTEKGADVTVDPDAIAKTPVQVPKEGRKLTFLRVFPESKIAITSVDDDPLSPRYGFPTRYDVTLGDETENQTPNASQTVSVHWTRVIHVADNKTSSEVVGTPRMQVPFNRLMDLKKLYSGSAEMYWQGAFPGLSFETHPSLGGDVQLETNDIKAELEQYMNRLQRYLITSGLSVKSLAPQVVDPTPQIERALEFIAMLMDIPKRILMGSERGELSSAQDNEEWDERLYARRRGFITPEILVPFVDRLIDLMVLPVPAEGYTVEWAEREQLKPLDKATLGKTLTEALTMYVAGNLESVMSLKLWLTLVLGFTEDEAEEIEEDRDAFLADLKQIEQEMGMDPNNPNPDQDDDPKEGDNPGQPNRDNLPPGGNPKPPTNNRTMWGD